MRVTAHKSLPNTPALPLAVEGWHAILSAGHGSGEVAVAWDHRALVAWVRGRPAGVLTWVWEGWHLTAAVQVGYVRPRHRRRGVYSALWEALLAEVRAEAGGQPAKVMSGVHPGNAPMLAAAEAQGRGRAAWIVEAEVPGEWPAAQAQQKRKRKEGTG